MADRFCKVGGSNLLDGTSLANAWETPLYTFTNMGASNTAKFSGTGGGVFAPDRSAVNTPIPNGNAVDGPTIITDNADGVVTFEYPGSGFSGIINFKDRPTAPQYISFIATSQNNIIFDPNDAKYQAAIDMGGSNTGNDITFKNVEIRNCTSSGVFGGDTANFTFDSCHIHDNGSLTSGTTPQDHGVYASGENLTFKNCHIYNNWGWGIHCYPHNHPGRMFYNNKIYNNGHGSGSDGSAADGILMTSGSGTIYNNLCYKNAGSGIRLWRTTASTSIYHNTCHENGRYGVHVGTGSGTTVSTLVKNNLITNNTSGSIYIDASSQSPNGATLDWNNMDAGYTAHASSSGTTSTNQATDTVILDECVDPTNATLASRNYNLKAGADSIWSATTNNVSSVGITTDFAGTSRVHPDQGAYAYGTPPPPEPPVIGHTTNYPVAVGVESLIALTITDAGSNTLTCTLTATGNTAIRLADDTNCTVTTA